MSVFPSRLNGGGRWRPAIVVALLCASTAIPSGAPAAAEERDELRVTIGFLLNFAKLTHWPDEAVAERKAFAMGVMGDDSLAEALQKLTRGRTVRGLPISVVNARHINDLRSCHLVFFGAEARHVASNLRGLEGFPILTIGAADSFLVHGGMVRLFRSGSQIRFAIDRDVLGSSELRMSPELQQLAGAR